MRVFRTIPARADTSLALTIGNFDGVHRGHRAMLERLLREASTRGLPAAVMTFEPHPREFFAPDQAPARLSSLREKIETIASLGVERSKDVDLKDEALTRSVVFGGVAFEHRGLSVAAEAEHGKLTSVSLRVSARF